MSKNFFDRTGGKYLVIGAKSKSLVKRVCKVCTGVGGYVPGILNTAEIHLSQAINDLRVGKPVIQALFQNPQNQWFVERLRSYGVQMELSEDELSQHSDTLQGQSIVISGVFAHHSRDEYKALIERHGGKNVGSISAKTSFILAGENMGPAKLEKAQKLGIRIVNEDEFLKMIE